MWFLLVLHLWAWHPDQLQSRAIIFSAKWSVANQLSETFIDIFLRSVKDIHRQQTYTLHAIYLSPFIFKVDSNPSVSSVRWTRGGRYIATTFRHVIPTLGLSDGGLYTCEVDTESVVTCLIVNSCCSIVTNDDWLMTTCLSVHLSGWQQLGTRGACRAQCERPTRAQGDSSETSGLLSAFIIVEKWTPSTDQKCILIIKAYARYSIA